MPIKLPFRPRGQSFPPDLWTQCPNCKEMLYNKQLDKNDRVCIKCGHHFRLRVDARLAMLLDPDSFEEQDAGLESVDPLGFVDIKPYPERLAAARTTTGIRDAAVWGFGSIGGTRVAICVMDFAFMGGSMGSVVGEKVTRAAEAALDERVPLIVVSASGGARMQEGTLALMQLAKTCRRARPAGRCRRAVHQHPDRPHHRRRLRLVRGARRRQPGGAGRAHRLCRRARRRRHHRRGAAGGLPARRVPVQPRLRRPGRPARRAARQAGGAAFLPGSRPAPRGHDQRAG